MHDLPPVRRRPSLTRASARRPLLHRILTVLALATSAAGCDDSFRPIEPSDLQFSVFGALDVSADTQWIRVMPIRPLAVTEPTPSPATVTLEDVATGRIIPLRDSLFHYEPPNTEIGSEGVFLHNFWTAEPIDPAATYRFLAQREEEEPSEAVVTLPPEYDVEVWIAQPDTDQRNLLRLNGLRHVGLVFSEVLYYDECGTVRIRHPNPIPEAAGDEHFIPLDRFRLRRGCGTNIIGFQRLFIVGSGAEWPKGAEYEAGGLAVPDAPSNISNSIGFLGGVLTRRVPFERCLIESRDPPTEHCKLRYDEQSATLAGVVTSARCGSPPVVGALVSLRDLDPADPDHRVVRLIDTRLFGAYEIAALEAGKRYALSVTRWINGNPYDQYVEHTDTLRFEVGERRTYDVLLEPLRCAP